MDEDSVALLRSTETIRSRVMLEAQFGRNNGNHSLPPRGVSSVGCSGCVRPRREPRVTTPKRVRFRRANPRRFGGTTEASPQCLGAWSANTFSISVEALSALRRNSSRCSASAAFTRSATSSSNSVVSSAPTSRRSESRAARIRVTSASSASPGEPRSVAKWLTTVCRTSPSDS